jgi:hypothetical protein
MNASPIQKKCSSAFSSKLLAALGGDRHNTTTKATLCYDRGSVFLLQRRSPDYCVMDDHRATRTEPASREEIFTPQASPRDESRPNSRYYRTSPYGSMAQHDHHPPCSSHEYAHHYWQYYNSYYGGYGYQHQYHSRDARRANEDERPIFRRRVSTESPDPQKALASFDEARRSSSRENAPGGADEAIDASDREVEMITSRRVRERERDCYPNRRPYHPQVSSHHYRYAPYHHNPYYYPYHGYHSYYENGYYYPAADNIVRQKKKKYDEFLLRPRKDYMIYANRCNSAMSDITASPTPSLSGFDMPEIEELGDRNKEDAPVFFNDAFELPRLKRRLDNDENDAFDFNEEGAGIVRMVSPAKKEDEVTKQEQRSVWRAKKRKCGNDNPYAVGISKNVSQSFYSEDVE